MSCFLLNIRALSFFLSDIFLLPILRNHFSCIHIFRFETRQILSFSFSFAENFYSRYSMIKSFCPEGHRCYTCSSISGSNIEVFDNTLTSVSLYVTLTRPTLLAVDMVSMMLNLSFFRFFNIAISSPDLFRGSEIVACLFFWFQPLFSLFK